MASNVNKFNPRTYEGERIIMVDPTSDENDDGERTFNPQEEYNIFVELKTFKKERQKITKGEQGEIDSNVTNDTERTTRINFIDGSQVGDDGERNLTTHYTELRTQFEGEQRDIETLGITNIDIEFNTSYTPMITINFTDIRGRMFEQGNDSKYNMFFNLPYPIFELTIKGYYGPPIKYCLHLTKFKSKFNSDTGNFEITTTFVGYTYAFLADTLLGYVRAIGETERGQDKLNDKELSDGFSISVQNDESSFDRTDPKTPITINEFLRRTQKINNHIDKLKQGDEQLIQYKKSRDVVNELSEIKDLIIDFRNTIQGLGEGSDGVVIDRDGVIFIPQGNNIIELKEDGDELIKTGDKESKVGIKNTYETLVKSVEDHNEQVNNDNYKVKLDDIRSADSVTRDGIVSNILSTLRSGDGPEYLINKIEQEYGNRRNADIVIIDTKALFDRIDRVQKTIDDDSKNSLDDISKRLQTEIQNKDVLGFKPTIANIIEIFSLNVEALMESIHEVSVEAGNGIDSKDKGYENYSRFAANEGNERELDTGETFYPFPEYRVKRDGTYEHAWIGNQFPQISEVRFVENLIDGLLETKKSDKNRTRNVRSENKGWFPIHPLDMQGVMYDENPWSQASNIDFEGFKQMAFNRAAIFLTGGYHLSTSTSNLTNDEIKLMAKLEANNSFFNLENEIVKRAMANIDLAEESFNIKDLNGLSESGSLVLDEHEIMNEINEPRTLTRDYYDGLNNNLPTYRGELMSELSSKFKNNAIGSSNNGYTNIDSSNYLPTNRNENSYHSNTKFIGDKRNTDYTRIVRDFTQGPKVIKSFVTFYRPPDQDEANFLFSTPFVTDRNRRDDNISEMVSNDKFLIKKSSGNFFSLNNDITSESFKVNPGYSRWQNEIYVHNRDRIEEGEGFDTSNNIAVGHNERNIYFMSSGGSDIFSIPYLGITMRTGSPNFLYPSYSHNQTTKEEGEKSGVPPGGEGDRHNFENKLFFNIFGTHFYYQQKSNRSKAFLFLNSIPFSLESISASITDDDSSISPFLNINKQNNLDSPINFKGFIESLFYERASFVSVPYSWILYVGALIWRYQSSSDPITFTKETEKNGTNYPVIPFSKEEMNYDFVSSNQNSYFNFSQITYIKPYNVDINRIINMNGDVKKFFVNKFKDWADAGSWLTIKDEFEIFTDDVGFNDIAEFWRELVEDVVDNGRTRYQKLKKDENGNIDFSNISSSVRNKVKEKTLNENYSIVGVDLKPIELIGDIDDNDILDSTHDYFLNNKTVDDYEQEVVDSSDIEGSPFNFFLEFNGFSESNRILKNFILEETIMVNPHPTTFMDRTILIEDTKVSVDQSGVDLPSTDLPSTGSYLYDFYIWVNSDDVEIDAELLTFNGVPEGRDDTVINLEKNTIKSRLSEYFTTFIEEFKKLKKQEEGNDDKRDELKKEIFNTLDNDDIKLSVYQDIKNVYDKWIASIDSKDSSNNFASLGCGPFVDNLFDNFRFLDRSFSDMSDRLLINPLNVVNYLTENFNKSFYNFLSRILSDNNMDFIPLPNYINFRDVNNLKKIFEPKIYNSEEEFNEELRSGPTFICMYIGERSNSLDLGDNSEYLNDGFDIEIREDGDGIDETSLPEDFKGKDENDDNDKVPVVMVNYSVQGQSIFKEFDLDQSEFTETNESLIVQEQISKRGGPNSKNMQGQNLYDIYQKRAYHCEIESLGAAYIQPLMYFQLNNVPMFHGVYTIIKVNHSIKPNHMTTSFQGVRLGRIRTPFVESETVFMNLIGSLSDIDLEDDVQLDKQLTGQVPPILNAKNSEDASNEIIVDPINEN